MYIVHIMNLKINISVMKYIYINLRNIYVNLSFLFAFQFIYFS